MRERSAQPHRVVFDLQACQAAGSATRGVGRYSSNLFRALDGLGGRFDLRALHASALNPAHLPHGARDRACRLPPLPDWGTGDWRDKESVALDAIAYGWQVAPLEADVLHVAHAFEGYAERVALPAAPAGLPGRIVSTTLFDLIPLRFPDHYLRDPVFARWYRHRLQWLRRADLLLSISEASRQDAIALLGIDPDRIVTIHGGVERGFAPARDIATTRQQLAARLGLRGHYVLYTGGDDFRKNLLGAIDGFAALAPHVRGDRQLLLVCEMDADRRRFHLEAARAAGLSEGDVVLTGFVSEEDLLALYQCCDAFVFPSLYEGLGLPVLEAMACGAPVIGGDNSSIRELIGRRDALFDAGDAAAMAAVLGAVLSSPDLAGDLRAHGLHRAARYTWERSACLAADAFEVALERARERGMSCAVRGWLPRLRLAVHSPVPPARSGIADYSALFLPFLARHFDIDVFVEQPELGDGDWLEAVRVFDATCFPEVAEQYDAILYDIGNSEFHAHMLPLLERHPGVVTLHDAYLSGLMGYLEFQRGEKGRFFSEMLHAHGTRARRLLAPARAHPDPVGAAHRDLPCTLRVLQAACGVISHSPFNVDLARRHFPQGWAAPYRVIAQPVAPVGRAADGDRAAARRALGFAPDDFVVATFGHVVWTKCGDRLLDACESEGLAGSPVVHLVFAGELVRDEFGARLEARLARSALGDRVRITGYLSPERYEEYLRVADVAVQLRMQSRGGTPKGVLDALARGLPVIVNNEASYTDYPDDVLVKLDPDPQPAALAAALVGLLHDPARRQSLGDSARAYVATHHAPERCAAAYAAAIHEFLARRRAGCVEAAMQAMAPHLAQCRDAAVATRAAAGWLEAPRTPAFERRRIVVDVSHIAAFDHRSGIQRVVRNIVAALACSARPGLDVEPVVLDAGRLLRASPWMDALGLLLPHERQPVDATVEVALRRDDILLMLDSSWERWPEFAPVFSRARELGVPVVSAVYDLLPIRLPDCFPPGADRWFATWIDAAAATSDAMVCISRATAEDLLRHLRAADMARSLPRVGYWHLGADFEAKAAGVALPAGLAGAPYLLMTGTIEPRKSHGLALAAMEILWERGCELSLCIAGKEGWMVPGLMQRLRGHPLRERRLFLIEAPDDGLMHALYEHAAGLLFVTRGEGFGLPLVEAAGHGTPILCSDLPVCREIAGEHAEYVADPSPDALAERIAEWWERRQNGRVTPSDRMPRLTWEESAEALLDVLLEERWMEEGS